MFKEFLKDYNYQIKISLFWIFSIIIMRTLTIVVLRIFFIPAFPFIVLTMLAFEIFFFYRFVKKGKGAKYKNKFVMFLDRFF